LRLTPEALEYVRADAKFCRQGGQRKTAAALDMLLALHERVHSASATDAAPNFQARVAPWMLATFGPEISADKIERNHRFLEEALELVQANGCSEDEARQLVAYVYGRPTGEVAQEVGGVMVTLAALCSASAVSLEASAEAELARVWAKVEAIRAKQALKPRHSPLPGPTLAGTLEYQAGVTRSIQANSAAQAASDFYMRHGHLARVPHNPIAPAILVCAELDRECPTPAICGAGRCAAYDRTRCKRCGWALKATTTEGCTAESCSCRCEKHPACRCGDVDAGKPA
jgi:hypothetical protein